MKTLILYASKYGAAEEIARRIAKNIEVAVVCDLKQKDIPKLSQFDCVIIGSSIYAGAIRKEAKTFISQNADELCKKRVGLFLSGFETEKEAEVFNQNFPPQLLQAAKAKFFAGGIFDPKKVGGAERFIYKLVTKQTDYKDTIDNDKIAHFAQAMKAD
ncbi:MAG: flavodoxin domain-containing protein [Oscillospiraceae bacterium]|nr:flavodoxin domain-containing protein [Oscillospiraceae bacterium]